MKIVIAADSFKGSLTSAQVNKTIAKAATDILGEEASCLCLQIADGGEGTLDAILENLPTSSIKVLEVTGPLGAGAAVSSARDVSHIKMCEETNPIGAGTTESSASDESRIKVCEVTGPIGTDVAEPSGTDKSHICSYKVSARYLVNGSVAFIEMAEASGLNLVRPSERNPLRATTRGTGELILDAIESGCRDIYVAIGGSATNDGGMGAMSALGYRFLDTDGRELYGRGEDLARLASIDDSGVHPNLSDCRIHVMCDVRNPLTGESGATYTYGPQKCSPELTFEDKKLLLDELENGMRNYQRVIEDYRYRKLHPEDREIAQENSNLAIEDGSLALEDGKLTLGDCKLALQNGKLTRSSGNRALEDRELTLSIGKIEGLGAAGGLGAGMYVFTPSELRSGINLLLDICRFDELIEDADIVVSGEGCTDPQTLKGKVIHGIARCCACQSKPLMIISGRVELSESELAGIGIEKAYAAAPENVPLEQAMANAESYLYEAAARAFKEFRA